MEIKYFLDHTTEFHIFHCFELTKKDFNRKSNISKNFDYQFLIRLYGDKQIKRVLKKRDDLIKTKNKVIKVIFNSEKIIKIESNFKLKKEPQTKEEKSLISNSSCCLII